MRSGDGLVAAGASPAAGLSEGRKTLIFCIMAVGQFLALMDIQIVAGSLAQIQAGLSAGPDEIAWVQTAYLMAEIVMVPLAAFLARSLSTQWLFTASAALFTASSLLCGLAWDLESMIVFRTIQGFVGGAMVPTCFAVGYVLFEGRKRATMTAMLGMVSTLGPMLGPSLGGWITEVADWRWLFFINVAPGLLIVTVLPLIGKVDNGDLSLLRRIDWLHVASLAVFLGGLQYVLEEGPRHEWFGDISVATAAWLSFVAALVFLERCFCSANPVVSLAPFRRRLFVLACILNFVIGVGMYATIYLTPVFLELVRGYSSLQIGWVVVVSGAFMALGAPISVRLLAVIDGRIVIAAGFALYATFLLLYSRITPEWGFAEFFLPQAVRGLAILLIIMPAISMALFGQEGDALYAASGLFNLMRNLGGAVGIAVVNSQLIDFTRVYALRLSEGSAQASNYAAAALQDLGERFGTITPDAGLAHDMALAGAAGMIAREAATLAFADIFHLMGLAFLAVLLIAPFCRTPALNETGSLH